MSWAEPRRLPSGGRRSAQRLPARSVDPVGQVRVTAGDPLEGQRRLGARRVLGEPGFSSAAGSIPSGAVAAPSAWPVASSPIASQAYSRRRRRLSPSLANRLRIGFAIGFAVLTGDGGDRRRPLHSSSARTSRTRSPAPTRWRSAARVGSREGTAARRPRGPRSSPQGRRRAELRDEISSETRDTALLVGGRADRRADRRAAAVQRPDRLDAAPAGGAGRRLRPARRRRPQRPGQGRRPLGDGGAGRPPSTRWPTSCERRGEPARPARPDERRVRAHRLARAAQPADLGAGLRRAADAGARHAHAPSRWRRSRSSSTTRRHLVRLLNDLLDLARSDAGRLTIRPLPTEVAPLVERRGADDARPDRGRAARP